MSLFLDVFAVTLARSWRIVWKKRSQGCVCNGSFSLVPAHILWDFVKAALKNTIWGQHFCSADHSRSALGLCVCLCARTCKFAGVSTWVCLCVCMWLCACIHLPFASIITVHLDQMIGSVTVAPCVAVQVLHMLNTYAVHLCTDFVQENNSSVKQSCHKNCITLLLLLWTYFELHSLQQNKCWLHHHTVQT